MNPRSIFVTGATGFVGRHLCEALRQCYPNARRAYLRREDDYGEIDGWLPFPGDVRNCEALSTAFKHQSPDLILHLAAQASVAAAERDAFGTWDVNVGGALAVAGAIRASVPMATLLAVSSAEVYGSNLGLSLCNENTPTAPVNAYGRSKLAAEDLFQDVIPGRLIIVRPFNHSGPGQDERFVLPSFAAQIVQIEAGRAEPFLKVGDLSVERDFLDVRDVVDAYLAIIRGTNDLAHRELFVVARGEGVLLSDLLGELRRQARSSFEAILERDRLRGSATPRIVGDSAALRAALGWAPRRSHADMIQAILAYWRQRG